MVYSVNKRNRRAAQSRSLERIIERDNAFLLYNGGCEEYEDIADYWRGGRIIKGVKLA